MSKGYKLCLAQIENLLEGKSSYSLENVIDNINMSFFTRSITDLEKDALLSKLEEEINEKEN